MFVRALLKSSIFILSSLPFKKKYCQISKSGFRGAEVPPPKFYYEQAKKLL